MGAPKNNQFWKLRSKHGRDKLFKTPELLWKAACEYFEWCDANPIEAQDNKGTKNVNTVKFNRPYTLHGFALYCDASSSWYNEFKKTATKDFLLVIRKIDDIIYNQKFEGATIGIFNHMIIARDLGLSDKSQVQHGASDDLLKVMVNKKSVKTEIEKLDTDD
ncbi:MAG: DNA-packaging protein [Bacteroidales bacterium]